METLGCGLTGYAQGGTLGALKSIGVSLLVNKISSGITNAAFPDINGATSDDFAALLAEVPDAIQSAEILCESASEADARVDR